MTGTCSMDRIIKVYHDTIGCYAQIGSDRDGLDLAEITYHEEGVKDTTFILTWQHARKFAEAIIELADKAEQS